MFTRTLHRYLRWGPILSSTSSAQGGSQVDMRTVRGPQVVASYRPGDEEDVEASRGWPRRKRRSTRPRARWSVSGSREPDSAGSCAGYGMNPTCFHDYARAASRKIAC